MTELLVAAQLVVFPLVYWAWRREGRPRPFAHWLHGVAFNKRAAEKLRERDDDV